MLDKQKLPSENAITDFIGKKYRRILDCLENKLSELYDFHKELRFPFGNSYGWGYKYACKSKHLCYVFFEKNSLTLLIRIGKREAVSFLATTETSSNKIKEAWQSRYPCGDGGWMYYRILSEKEIDDVLKLISIKKSAVIK